MPSAQINQESFTFGAEKSVIREIAAFGAKRKAQIGADSVFDFSLGNPSVPAPDEVRRSIEKNLALPSSELHGYTPAAGLPFVREKLASLLNTRFGTAYAADDLYLTCGAAASVNISLNAVLNPGDEVVVISPYFPEYRVWIQSAGAVCVEVPADKKTFQPDIAVLEARLSARTKCLIIDSPNNPTGAVYTAKTLRELAEALRRAEQRFGTQIYLLSDEPYREISYGAAVPWVPDFYERSLVAYSYSKALSLAGERIGWILVPPTNPDHDILVPAIAGAGRKLGFVCAPALFQRVLADCAHLPADVAAYKQNRQTLTEALLRLGYTFIEPEGAFYLWLKALEPSDEAFCQRAKSFELLIVPSTGFGCTGWARVSYCVSHTTIVNSLPAWKALKESYSSCQHL